MKAEALNRHIERGCAAVWSVEEALTVDLVKLLREIGGEAAARFERKVTRHTLTAAAVEVAKTLTMIAVYPHPDQAAQLAQPDGQTAEQIHCTLAFLGDTTEEQFDALVQAVHAAVAVHGGVLEGVVGGAAVFAKGPDGHPSILLPDVPGLAELRHNITQAAEQAGFVSPSEHGWTPHLTLAYTQDATPPSVELLGQPLTFDSVSVVRGDIFRRDFHLGTGKVTVFPALVAAATPPGWSAPDPDEILPTSALGDVAGTVDQHLAQGLQGFMGAMPTCVGGSGAPAVRTRTVPAAAPTRSIALTPAKASEFPVAEGRAQDSLDKTQSFMFPKNTFTPDYLTGEWHFGVDDPEFTLERVAQKQAIARSLADRLVDHPAWESYVREATTGADSLAVMEVRSEKAASDLVSNWATTSGDNNPLAWALQRAVAEEFGLGEKIWQTGIERTAKADASMLFDRVDDFTKSYGEAFRAFARAMYDHTQEELARAGVKGNVTLYRGMTRMPNDLLNHSGERVPVEWHPMSSFTDQVVVADEFAGGGIDTGIFSVEVPVERIIGTSRTGFGSLAESEFVVLGLPADAFDEAWLLARESVDGTDLFWGTLEDDMKAAESGARLPEPDGLWDPPDAFDPSDLTSSARKEVWQLDDTVENADWPKHAYDLLHVTDAKTLNGWLEAVNMSAAAFKALPFYAENVAKRPWLSEANWEPDSLTAAAAKPCDGISLKWDVHSPFYGNTLARTGEHIAAISRNVRADVMDIVERSYKDGLTVVDAADAIRGAMDGLSKGWAETIARTELNRLANGASLSATEAVEAALDGEVTYTKTWLTAPGAVHPRHELYEGLDGQTVPLDGTFQVGDDELRYPGDPDGSAEETINCRCTIVYNESAGASSSDNTNDLGISASAAVPSKRQMATIERISGRRRELRAALTASSEPSLVTNYDMTMGSLLDRAFTEAALTSGNERGGADRWPCESVRLEDTGEMLYREGDAAILFKTPGGAVVAASIAYGWLTVRVAAVEDEAVAEVCSAFRASYPASYITAADDGRVPITFWTYGEWGPVPRLRKIEASPWQAIRENYTAGVRDQLAALMEWERPTADGQLILWQGPPGTGKTWALRALAAEWAPWAEFNYITDPDAFFVDKPSYMVDVLLSDSYDAIDEPTGDVYSESADESKWRVLILEDTGELLSANAKEKYGQGLSRLLNVVDGMIGQGLKVLALVTTNDELGDLHPAVARPGRCASQIEFAALTREEAVAWTGDEEALPGTLAELYARHGDGAAVTSTPVATPVRDVLAIAPDMPCADCEHSYADHDGACTVQGCSCGAFDDGGTDTETASATTTVNLPDGVSSVTLTFGNSNGTFAPALVDTDPEAVVDLPLPQSDASLLRWEAVLAPEGKATDDGRIFAPGSISWRELPLTLMALVETGEGGHVGAEIVGRIDRIWRDAAVAPVFIRGGGVFDDSDFGREVARLVGNRMLTGNSVDLAIREYIVGNRSDYVDGDGNWIGDDKLAEQGDADLLDILFGDEDLVYVVTDGVIGMSTVCPFPAFEDGEIALMSDGRILRGFFVVADTTGLRWNVRTENSFELCEGLTASAAGLVPVTPPAAWFEMPEPDELTPLTVTDDGLVYGHAWAWDSCHIGIPNKCTVAPHSNTGYAHFLLKEVEVDLSDDVTERIHCGTITLGTNHARQGLGAEAAAEHYDHTGAAVADVVITDGEFGGWVSGALRPDTAAERVRELRGAVLSGDWRRIDGHLELVGLLAVNVGGFPVPRAKALVAAGAEGEPETVTLIAAGQVIAVDKLSEADRARLKALAARAGSDEPFKNLAALADSAAASVDAL